MKSPKLLIKRFLRRAIRPSSDFAAKLGTRYRFCARLYYFLFNDKFGREQQAFLEGQRRYDISLDSPGGSMPILRRNTHRIEKGLLMRPRRIPFAVDYIAETVDAFTCAAEKNTPSCDDAEMAWAYDVLTEYFSIHADQSSVLQPKIKFEHCDVLPVRSSERRIPYLRDLRGPSSVGHAELAALAKRRRSVRWFLKKPVERILVDQAIEIGAQAPSACNRQPFVFRIFDDAQLVQDIVGIPFGLAGYGHNVPVIAVVLGQQSAYFDERDRHLIYIDASLAVMGFILALESLGLSSCCVNWPDIEEKERRLAKLLNTSIDERPVMLIAIGYPDPDGMVANSTKKSLQTLRQWNFE